MMQKYTDRHQAGKILAEQLKEYTKKPNVIVLALPRGGVPVAYEIAQALSVPLDVLVARKLGVPWHEELAMGAIASGGTVIFNQEILKDLDITQEEIEQVILAEKKELERREKTYRGNRPKANFTDKIIILVDDGIATGATMRAAIKALRTHKPQKIIIAVPVAAKDTYEQMTPLVDQIVCPVTPKEFYAVGTWYEVFDQTTDEEVFSLLN